MSHQQQRKILCDTHVHIYDCFDLGTILDNAFVNFRNAAERADIPQFEAVLMLSETHSDHWFERLMSAADSGDTLGTRWSFSRTNEPESLRLTGDNGRSLLILAGRQIVSREKLEILALASRFECPDGDSAENIIKRANDAGSLVVAPWGAGKWWGKRGKILSKLLESTAPEQLLLGDNSGRPWFIPTPKHFARAAKESRKIIPGSDPLPFPGEEKRIGSTGCVLDGKLDPDRPAHSIRELLGNDAKEPVPYIRLERLLPFFRNQVGMQLRKKQS